MTRILIQYYLRSSLVTRKLLHKSSNLTRYQKFSNEPSAYTLHHPLTFDGSQALPIGIFNDT